MAQPIRTPLVRGVNDLYTKRPDLMLDWDWNENTKDPHFLQEGSGYKAYWICHECGHKWSCRLDSRTKNMHGCPMCARSGGSSVNDYTLYKLLEMSLDCEVLYRYKVLIGCEADVYIPSMKIAIEYDGYGFHKYEEKQIKDREKEDKLRAEGIRVCRFVERQDRNGSVVPNGDVIYVPEMTYDRFGELKETLVAGIILWGILNKEDIPKEFYSLSLNGVRTKTSKPVYQKSLKRYLEDRDDVFWDYDKNGSLLPENVFASIKKQKVFYKCKYDHSFESTPVSIKEGYGCPICSRHRSQDVPLIEKMYNVSLMFNFPKDMVYDNGLLDRRYDYTCPFCGEESSKMVAYSMSREGLTEFCSCIEGIKVYLTILGVGKDDRIYYCINADERYFMCICEDVNDDIFFQKLKIHDNDFRSLDEDRFKEAVGDPYILVNRYNSYNTVPINKRKFLIVAQDSDEDVTRCYSKLSEQRDNGLIQGTSKEKVSLKKNDIVQGLKGIFEKEFGMKFALNRTVNGLNRELFCKTLNLSLIVEVNVVRSDKVDELQYQYDERKLDSFVYITDIPDFIDEDNGFFYLSRVQNKDELEEVFQELGKKICNYWKSLGLMHMLTERDEF